MGVFQVTQFYLTAQGQSKKYLGHFEKEFQAISAAFRVNVGSKYDQIQYLTSIDINIVVTVHGSEVPAYWGGSIARSVRSSIWFSTRPQGGVPPVITPPRPQGALAVIDRQSPYYRPLSTLSIHFNVEINDNPPGSSWARHPYRPPLTQR